MKLFYVVMVVLIIAVVSFILREWKVIPVIMKVLSVVSPFFIGFVIAWLLNPLVNKLSDKGMKRSWAVVLVYLMLIVIIYLFCLAVIPTLVDQINEMAKMIPDLLGDAREVVNDVFLKLSRSTPIDRSSVKLEFLY